MEIYEQYLQLKEKAYIEDSIDNDELAEKYMDKAIEIRNNSFTKEDWERLIKETINGRAKYEDTKMMKEKFPD